MVLSKMLSLTILNYFLLAVKVSFQYGASEIKVTVFLKRHMILHFGEIVLAKIFFLI